LKRLSNRVWEWGGSRIWFKLIKSQTDVMNEIEALKEELRQTKLAYWMSTQIGQFKGGFLARTAHELRSPMSSLIGLHQIILSDLCENPQEEREFLAQSYEAAQKFLKLLDELIDISKLESSAIAIEPQPVQLSQVFDKLEKITHLPARNRRLDLTIVSPPPDLWVMTDYQYLLRVLVNLVDTTISQMREGAIKVSAASEPSSELTLSNQGCIVLNFPAMHWHEAIDFLASPAASEAVTKSIKTDVSQTMQMSPGMKLLVAQSLLEMMGGSLKIVAAADSETTIQLNCLLPLVPTETVDR
jgi:light-regulated signal transduction histidine kinase (bacteriophytochrome)